MRFQIGQFSGYRNEPGVASDSNVATFAALRLEVDSWRWNGVPFLIRAGKCLPVTATEVIVKLKRPPLANLAPGQGNHLRLRLAPDVKIGLGAAIVEPVLEEKGQAPVIGYEQGSWGPAEATRLATDIGGWARIEGESSRS